MLILIGDWLGPVGLCLQTGKDEGGEVRHALPKGGRPSIV